MEASMDIKLFGDKPLDRGSIEALANRIFTCSIVGANELKRTAEGPIPRSIWLSIVFEFMFFYLTLVRYQVWAHLPKDKQEALANKTNDVLLRAAVNYVFEDDDNEANEERVENFKGELAARMEEYKAFKVLVRKSQSEKSEGTALWAFCNKAAALAGKPEDLVCIMTTHAHVHDSMLAIGIQAPESADRSV
jgi:hypothetical protein